jgi:hypothetical protein
VASLLDQLLILAERLADLPQPELRGMLDALQFDIKYHPAVGAVDVSFTLQGDSPARPERRQASQDGSPESAPGRIRTCATASGGRCSIP